MDLRRSESDSHSIDGLNAYGCADQEYQGCKFQNGQQGLGPIVVSFGGFVGGLFELVGLGVCLGARELKDVSHFCGRQMWLSIVYECSFTLMR